MTGNEAEIFHREIHETRRHTFKALQITLSYSKEG